jgi:hypothetical protein
MEETISFMILLSSAAGKEVGCSSEKAFIFLQFASYYLMFGAGYYLVHSLSINSMQEKGTPF